MPLSPHTPPGTHIVVTWAPTDLDEYVYRVILPPYRARCAEILRSHYLYKPTLSLGNRFVLTEIIPCPIASSGYLCKLRGQQVGEGYALEHFDVAQLPKAITDLLQPTPMDIEEELRYGGGGVLQPYEA